MLDDIVERHAEPEVVLQAVEAIAGFPSALALPRLERIAREHPMTRARREAVDRLADVIGRDGLPPDAGLEP